MNTAKSVTYESELLGALQDPAEAAEYLDAALADGDPDVFLLALKDVVKAHGGMTRVAAAAQLNRVSLYKALSKRGNPELRSLNRMLRALGLRISITTEKTAQAAGGLSPS